MHNDLQTCGTVEAKSNVTRSLFHVREYWRPSWEYNVNMRVDRRTRTWNIALTWHGRATTTSVIPHDVNVIYPCWYIHECIAVVTRADVFFYILWSVWKHKLRKWFYWSMIYQNCGILLPKATRTGIKRRMGGHKYVQHYSMILKKKESRGKAMIGEHF